MNSKISEFDFIEGMIILLSFIGFTYTLYSFLSFAWSDLSGIQIALAIFGWIIFWELVGVALIFFYRLCIGRLVLLQKLGRLLARP